jgi:hypothetical protein
MGVPAPGTRGQRVEEQIGFVPRLIRSIIFYDFPSWVFTIMYIGFGALVVITFFLVRPKSGRGGRPVETKRTEEAAVDRESLSLVEQAIAAVRQLPGRKRDSRGEPGGSWKYRPGKRSLS